MFQNNYPLFNSGRILKIEMLEELRDFPREILDINFKDYSNGIISGCDIEVNNDYIIVTKGIIKHQDMIYILKKNYTIQYESTNQVQVLKIRFLGETINKDFIKLESEIFLDDDLQISKDEMELCRFKLKKGARLRTSYVDFRDMSTEYDTVSIINVPYSAYGESSLNPNILRKFGRELLRCNVSEAWDISFGMTCIQSRDIIQKEVIVSYLIYKLGIEKKDYSNEELYLYLLDVLNRENNGQTVNDERRNRKFKTILID
ncbi:hypothetical protein [Clostridium lundense]|uniref:hypothetical protein n=1 Tax=Clostridium lundense TaxID=319475 RepID=UPI000485616B|nr:hypothetical protein [Clostridium lundense]